MASPELSRTLTYQGLEKFPLKLFTESNRSDSLSLLVRDSWSWRNLAGIVVSGEGVRLRRTLEQLLARVCDPEAGRHSHCNTMSSGVPSKLATS